MGNVFRWLTARRENQVTVHPPVIERPRITIIDIIKVVGVAAGIVWGAAMLSSKLESHDAGIRDHEARIRPLEQHMASIDAKMDIVIDFVKREPNGRNHSRRSPR